MKFAPYPTLSITYDHVPAVPTITMSPSMWASDGNLYTSSATPSFTVTSTDQDGDPLEYKVLVISGSTVVAEGTTSYVTSGTPASWTDPVALTDGTKYTYDASAYDGTEWSATTTQMPFTVETDTPAAPTVTCSGYPAGTWTAQVSGGTTCSWNAPLPHMNGYLVRLDGSGLRSGPRARRSPSILGSASTPSSVTPVSAAEVVGSTAAYTFGVGASGAVLSPANWSQTSTVIPLQAAAPAGYTSATFEYRVGTGGSFTDIPGFTWPVSMTSGSVGVKTAQLSWPVTQTVADDGLPPGRGGLHRRLWRDAHDPAGLRDAEPAGHRR